jgi:hypothetical protein
MSQILHIFRKDVRHYWPEISASLLLLAVYAWHAPSYWRPEQEFAFGFQFLIWKPLPRLVPIAWCFLIVRAVQGESLVGDRQFWVTRPYECQKLLAAKILFVLAFVNLPLFIVQVILLAEAGFAPASHIPGLLYIQLLMGLFLVLPTATAATITSSVGQVLLVALIGVLYLVGVAALDSVIPNSRVASASSIPESLQALIFIGTCLFVVVLQFAQRKTWRSRIALLCAAAAIAIILVATPYAFFRARAYPLPENGEQPLAQFSLDSTAPHAPADVFIAENQKEIQISLPLRVSGVDNDSVVQEEGMLVLLEGSDGLRWSSGWVSAYSFLWPNQDRSTIRFTLKRKFFERIKSVPVNVRVSIALAEYRETNDRTIVATSGEFSIPGVGICSIVRMYSTFPDCRSPLKTPSFIARTDAATTTCRPNANKVPFASMGIATGGAWDDTSSPADLGVNPIESFNLYFSPIEPANRGVDAPQVCPGTPVTFHSPEFSQRSRVEFEIDAIHLTDYQTTALLFQLRQ